MIPNARVVFLLLTGVFAMSCAVGEQLEMDVSEAEPGDVLVAQAGDDWFCAYRKARREHAGLNGGLEGRESEFFVYNCRSNLSGCFVTAYGADAVPSKIKTKIPSGGIYDECNGLTYDFNGKLTTDIGGIDFYLDVPEFHFTKEGMLAISVDDAKKTIDLDFLEVIPGKGTNLQVGEVTKVSLAVRFSGKAGPNQLYFWVLEDWNWKQPLCQSKASSDEQSGVKNFSCEITVPDTQKIIIQVSLRPGGPLQMVEHEVEVYSVESVTQRDTQRDRH